MVVRRSLFVSDYDELPILHGLESADGLCRRINRCCDDDFFHFSQSRKIWAGPATVGLQAEASLCVASFLLRVNNTRNARRTYRKLRKNVFTLWPSLLPTQMEGTCSMR